MVKEIVNRLNKSNSLGLTEKNVDHTTEAISSWLLTFGKVPLNNANKELLVFPYSKGENPTKWLKIIVRAKKRIEDETKIEFSLSIFLLSRQEFEVCKMLEYAKN